MNGNEYQYYNDNSTYIINYINGEKNGIFREYDYNGNLMFEGEHLNGQKMEKERNIIKKEN